jgi:hypothetical protein
MSTSKHALLIDACIASGLSDPADVKLIRALKIVILLQKGPVGLAMTRTLRREWMDHASRYMLRFLARMESRRKVDNYSEKRVADFRSAIENHVDQQGKRAEIYKDAHLTEAALLHSIAIMSIDEKQRRMLADLSEHYLPLQNLQWFNPCHESDDIQYWMNHAPHDASLGTLEKFKQARANTNESP